jgi:hypothetical protein
MITSGLPVIRSESLLSAKITSYNPTNLVLTSFLRSFTKNYFSLAYSDLAAIRMGILGSASFQRVKKS